MGPDEWMEPTLGSSWAAGLGDSVEMFDKEKCRRLGDFLLCWGCIVLSEVFHSCSHLSGLRPGSKSSLEQDFCCWRRGAQHTTEELYCTNLLMFN